MKLTYSISPRLRIFIFLIAFNVLFVKVSESAPLSLSAVIAKKGLGCEMKLLENVLDFKPLQANKLTGAIQALQIKPLTMQISCIDETEALQPMLSLQGNTPYSNDTLQTLFLDGAPNGLGFMIRQSSDDKPISLADFYRPDLAIGNNGYGVPIKILNSNNQYHSNSLLWVGVIGPLQPNIIAGHFQATLTVNVAFE